jgi:hypothetical protein
MKKLTLALVLIGALMLTLGSATAVASPSSTGATVLNYNNCVPLIGGGIVCFESKGMINETTTPSGNQSYVTNYRQRLQVIENGEVVWETTSNERFHALTMDGVLQELSMRARFTVTSFGQTFCVQYHLHGTNGEDQFVRIDFC